MTRKMIPWPGPIPLGSEQRTQLFGRNADIEHVLVGLRARSVVEIVAPTGVGKTSLLSAGVIPEIKRLGLIPVMCRDWNIFPEGGAAALYCHVLNDALRGTGLDVSLADYESPVDFLKAVDAAAAVDPDGERRVYPSRLVIIFDQVEELLRYDKAMGLDFLSLIADAAKQFSFRQIVSLRREFKADLRHLESVLASDIAFLDVEPVSEDAIHDLIVKPLESSGWLSIEKDAVGVIEGLWAHAASGRGGEIEGASVDGALSALASGLQTHRGGDQVGLLHMQALLWSLAEYCLDMNLSRFTESDLMDFSKDLAARLGPRAVPDVFAGALRRYVDSRLAKQRLAETDLRVANTTEFVAARIGPQLSSSSYKLIREASDLLWQSLDTSFDELGIDQETALALYEESEDNPVVDRLLDDVQGRTAGRMKNDSPMAAARALIAAFERALSWLREAKIISDTSTLQSGRMIMLVHDGFGPAVVGWSRMTLGKPRIAMDSLTAISGADLIWETFPEGAVVDSVRWRGCYIRTNMRDVTFRNADLRGSLFDSSVLTNVRFENCDMRGIRIGPCVFDGPRGVVITGCEIEAMAIQDVAGEGDLTIEDAVAKGVFLEKVAVPAVHLFAAALRQGVFNGKPGAGVKPVLTVTGSILNQWYFGDVVGKLTVEESAVLFCDSDARLPDSTVLNSCELLGTSLAFDPNVQRTDCRVLDLIDVATTKVAIGKGPKGVSHRMFGVSTTEG